ncbi:MAG: ACP S-malonyltransferase [Candidatus Kapabacteria bacterium]|nr:ACP S-malonyltransferase [Candidatus Kapabacteria bacterium]
MRIAQTKFSDTQPALFVHEAIVLAVTSVKSSNSAVAGHSLGEYSALYAAGVMTFEDALEVVQLRANLMYEAGSKIPGTMVAIVGLEDDVVATICTDLNGVDGHVIVPANYNSPGQVVISGSAEYVRECMPLFKERGAKIVKELQVSGAFHSPLLAEAEAGLAEKIRSTAFSNAIVPVYVNVSGEAVTDASMLRDAAIRQLTSPVLWTTSLQNMWKSGITTFCEIGPGKVLQGLVKRTLSEAQLMGVDTLTDVLKLNGEGASA